MNVKPAIGFLTKDGEAGFTEKVATILEKMKRNSKYPSPMPTLEVVQAAFDSYKLATAVAAQGGKENIAARNARRAELVSLLRQLASYVSATANGDLEALISSGFPIQKPSRTPIGNLPTPQAPRVSQGPVTGSLKAVTKPVYGGSTYNWRVALASAPTVFVQTAQTTGARAAFYDLTAGEIYNVDVNVVGTAGTSDYSDDGTMRIV
jgi:hypothetical protein